jgi:hypothetical protein
MKAAQRGVYPSRKPWRRRLRMVALACGFALAFLLA